MDARNSVSGGELIDSHWKWFYAIPWLRAGSSLRTLTCPNISNPIWFSKQYPKLAGFRCRLPNRTKLSGRFCLDVITLDLPDEGNVLLRIALTLVARRPALSKETS